MKIADFGLARDVHQIDYYRKTTDVSYNRFLVLLYTSERTEWSSIRSVVIRLTSRKCVYFSENISFKNMITDATWTRKKKGNHGLSNWKSLKESDSVSWNTIENKSISLKARPLSRLNCLFEWRHDLLSHPPLPPQSSELLDCSVQTLKYYSVSPIFFVLIIRVAFQWSGWQSKLSLIGSTQRRVMCK